MIAFEREAVLQVFAGEAPAGEYRCAACGYGVTIQLALPLCPMCQGDCWEAVAGVPLLL